MAGEKLLEVPAIAQDVAHINERDSILRWYRALRQPSGAYPTDLYATQTDGEGNDAGIICAARIDDIWATSAILCRQAAQTHLSWAEPDSASAAREGVSAVEGLCRALLGDETPTFGA